MKPILLIAYSVFLITAFTNAGCKKNKPDTTCGCSATETKYTVNDFAGTLSYHTHKKQ